MSRQYRVEAVWDAKAGVFYAKSNIPGLNIETATMAEFIEVVKDLAPDLISANDPGPHSRTPSVHLETKLDLAYA